MMKRYGGAKIGGCVVVIVAAIASCSFPTYDITVTGGSTGATTSATGSSGSAGGSGGASTSSGSGGGAGGASATASSGSSAASTSGTASTSTTGSSSSTGSGPCTTDADGDTYISAKCPGGNDCADGDALANPKGDFHPFPITNPPPGTLPFDFNCSGSEEAETPKLTCGGDCSSMGFNSVVACGVSAPLGKCGGLAPLCGFTALSPAVSKTQRCK